jgi:hypothetical protein
MNRLINVSRIAGTPPFIVGCFLLGLALPGNAARAEDTDVTQIRKIEQQSKAKPPTLTDKEERKQIQAIIDDRKKKPVPVKGDGESSELGGRSTVEANAPGTDDFLTFDFIDPAGNVLSFPTIGSVTYEVNLDPFTTVFSPIGTSGDAGSDFGLNYTLPTGEILIEAIPFNIMGDPFFFADPSDPNINLALGLIVNIPVPEPGSAGLLAFGVIAALLSCRRRRTDRLWRAE